MSNTLGSVTEPKAFQRRPELQSTLAYMGSLMTFLAKGQETGGRFALMDFRSRPGNEPPPHSHAYESELYYVLEGVLEIYCQEKILLVHPGEIAFLPQDAPHAFYVRSSEVRALILVVAGGEHPVGLDSYFIGMGDPAGAMALPEKAVTHVLSDPTETIKVAAANGIRILTPAETVIELPHYPGFGVPREFVEQSSRTSKSTFI